MVVGGVGVLLLLLLLRWKDASREHGVVVVGGDVPAHDKVLGRGEVCRRPGLSEAWWDEVRLLLLLLLLKLVGIVADLVLGEGHHLVGPRVLLVLFIRVVGVIVRSVILQVEAVFG